MTSKPKLFDSDSPLIMGLALIAGMLLAAFVEYAKQKGWTK